MEFSVLLGLGEYNYEETLGDVRKRKEPERCCMQDDVGRVHLGFFVFQLFVDLRD
jgi:hypothetical protein